MTLDTFRADALGFDGGGEATPMMDSLAGRGVRFGQAYAPVPLTLPSHTSLMTGLYPAEHGVHENGRSVPGEHRLLAERLGELGYTSAAFISGFPLARQFGLSRGFDHYDDKLGDDVERDAGATTQLAVQYLSTVGSDPLFLWVHYFDAHAPYAPPEPFAVRWQTSPYLGEVAFIDQEVGRLTRAFNDAVKGEAVTVVVGDHGESLGEHDELRHGNLLYQAVMRVPLVISGSGLESRTVSTPVSTRRVFHTLLGLAGGPREGSLLEGSGDVVLAEALKPYLNYGWQPQVMAIEGTIKVIHSGETVEIYDVVSDPAESVDLAAQQRPSATILRALNDYPLASKAEAPRQVDADELAKLAALGYVSSTGEARLRPNAPRPSEMTHLFAALDRGSGLFVRRLYEEAIAVYEKVIDQDPQNLMVTLRLAVAHSFIGDDRRAEHYFDVAARIDPDSIDRKRYRGLHLCRSGDWAGAQELLLPILPRLGDNLPVLECLAEIRSGEQQFEEAERLLVRIVALKPDSAAASTHLGEARMALGKTAGALEAFEAARGLAIEPFAHHLELGVLYVASGQLERARAALDLVPRSHPGYPMALFKRAQVSVLLGEVDAGDKVRAAYAIADTLTRRLIENEHLFSSFDLLAEP